MSSVEKDPVSGQYTTGHEWDGIKELNTPMPRWWVIVFWLCIIWSVGYWVVYPTWPTTTGFTPGIWHWSARQDLETDLAQQKVERSQWLVKLEGASVEDIEADKTLRNYALAGGKIAFADNCAPCHGTNGVGRPGAYPILTDDVWLWGGSLQDIYQTINHGIRNEDPESRTSMMPNFGADGILTPEQVQQVAEYVDSVSHQKPAVGSPGEAVFADNCVACHGEGAVGNKDVGAPPLNTTIRTFTKPTAEGVAQQVNKPKHGAMPSWGRRLDPATVKELAIYVHSLGGGQ
jgi:cytochrome c oxidase cbb3-type subunit III